MAFLIGMVLCAGCLVMGNRADVGREVRWTRAGLAAVVIGVVAEVLR